MTEAAKRSGTTLETVRRYAGSALETRSGRIDAKPTDRIARSLQLLTDRGYLDVYVTSRDATRVARYSNAIRKFVLYGDDSALKQFEGKTLKVGGKTYPFLTDKATINRLARAGEISFLDIYSSTSGGES